MRIGEIIEEAEKHAALRGLRQMIKEGIIDVPVSGPVVSNIARAQRVFYGRGVIGEGTALEKDVF